MNVRTPLYLLTAMALLGGSALAADVPAAVQQTLDADYKSQCTAAMSPTDANFDTAFADLSPDFVGEDYKGNKHTHDEVIAQAKQQLKQIHVTTCDSSIVSTTAQDDSTVVAVVQLHLEGDLQAPDGKHELNLTSKSSDTWKLVNGKWLQTHSKDLRNLVKVDGNVVQDEGD